MLTGEAVPAPLTDRAAIGRVVEEHAQLRTLLDQMRRTADRMDQISKPPFAALRNINATLTTLLLPHQMAEEQVVFPELAHRLGGRDPLGGMTRMHDEIAHAAARFSALVQGLPEASVSDGEVCEGATSALCAGCSNCAAPGRRGGLAVAGRGLAGACLKIDVTAHSSCRSGRPR